MRTTWIGLSLLVTAGSALAQPDVGPTSKPARDDRKLTVMWAPLRAIFGLAEVTGEYRLADKIGVSVTLGGGRRKIDVDMSTTLPSTELEGGLQGRYYLLGDFTHGMELGLDLLDEYVDFDKPLPANVAGAAAGGVTAGAFAGYKVATRIGFTFEAQLGARYLIVDPPVTGMGMPMITNQQKVMPMLHLNIGWTF